jgi:transposase, IS6 family
VKVSGRWRYLYRAIGQFGRVVDVYLSARRDANAARKFFDSAMAVTQTEPVEVVTDRAHICVRVIEDMLPAAWHHVERYANNPIECDHGRLKARLRPMRGLKRNAPLGLLPPGTLSCRTCAEATTNTPRPGRDPPMHGGSDMA